MAPAAIKRRPLPPDLTLPAIPARSNFLDGTDEEDASDHSRPSSASSDADFSVLQSHVRKFTVNGDRRGGSPESSTPRGDSLQDLLVRAHKACVQAQAALNASKQALEVALKHVQQPPSGVADGRLSALTSSSSSDTDMGKRTHLPSVCDASLVTQASARSSIGATGMTSFFEGADEDSDAEGVYGEQQVTEGQPSRPFSREEQPVPFSSHVATRPASLPQHKHSDQPPPPLPASPPAHLDPPHSAFSSSSTSDEDDSDKDDASSHMYEHRNDNILDAEGVQAGARADEHVALEGQDSTTAADIIAGLSSTLIDEGQVIPYRLLDSTSEYLLLEDTNERVKLVEIAAPEPVRSNLHSRESMTVRSLERISEEIDPDAEDVRQSRESERGHALAHTGVPLVRVDSAVQETEEVLQDPPDKTPSLDCPATPLRHPPDPPKPSRTPETPRSTQVLSSLIGEHLHSSSPLSSFPYSAAPPTSNRHSLDSSPTHSAQARRQRLINSLSDSLKVAGVLTDTIRHLEEQVETLQEGVLSPPNNRLEQVETLQEGVQSSPAIEETSMRDQLAQSHWSSSTSQFDISDSGAGFQLRSDLDAMQGVSMDVSGDSLLNVSDLGMGGASESAASLFGLKQQPPTSTAPASNGSHSEATPQTEPTSTAFLLPGAVHSRQYTTLSSKSSSGSGDTYPNPPSERSKFSMDDTGSARAKLIPPASQRKPKSRSNSNSTTSSSSSSALRSKLAKTFFADRPRVSKKQLAVNIAQANARDRSDNIVISPVSTASPSSALAPPPSPACRGRKLPKTDVQQSVPKLSTNTHDGEDGKLALPSPLTSQRKSPKLAHRLFDRMRRDSSSSSPAPIQTPRLQPRDDGPGRKSPREASRSPTAHQPVPRSPSAPPQLDLGDDFAYAPRQDKGKARAISPDNPHAVPSYRGTFMSERRQKAASPVLQSPLTKGDNLATNKSSLSVHDRESTSEGDCAEYHTAYSDSVSTLSLPSTAATDQRKDTHHIRSKTTTPQPHDSSSRSSMATITLTPKVSLSELSLHTPPSFPLAARVKTTMTSGDDDEEAREKARKDFQEWLEKQARTRRYW